MIKMWKERSQTLPVYKHPLVDILEDETGNVYITKGDANESSDGWTVNNKNLTGKVLVKIKWLGWPTVKLSELLRQEDI